MLRVLSFPTNSIPQIPFIPSGEVAYPEPVRNANVFNGVETDLAISGPGWFVVREPVSGDLLYRRFGDFRLDDQGYLITDDGWRVQGYSDPSCTNRGDIQIDYRFLPAAASPTSTISTFHFETNGNLRVYLSDGTEYVRAQILLQKFAAPENLERIRHHVFASSPAARPIGVLAIPGSNGLGEIIAGALEAAPLPALLKLLPRADDGKALIEGLAVYTGRATDLAIRGAGAFLVRDPETGELFATRAGMFLLDRDGYLITYDRKRVQGYNPMFPLSAGDIQAGLNIPATTDSAATQTFVSVDRAGQVSVAMTDGTTYVAGQILLHNFHHPEQLIRTNLGQFSGVAAAQRYVVENVGRYGGGFSRIEAGRLELINVPRDLLARRQRLNFVQQGALVRTGVPSELAVDGEGFFQLKNPRNGQVYVTRRGGFHFDASGYLVSAHGFRVQGYCTAGLSELGDVRIDTQGAPVTMSPTAIISAFSISRDGYLNLHMSDGTEFHRGQVLLQRFREPFLLRPIGGGLYGNLAAAVPRELASPGTSGLGNIESSALELPDEREQLSLPERNGFRLGITGEPGSKWTIQATENFTTWKTIGTITNAAFESEFCDRDAKCHSRRFYRVLAEYPVYVPRTYSGPIDVLPAGFSFSSSGIPGLATELQGLNPHRAIYHRARH